MLNIGFINKYIINSGIGDGGGGYSVLGNYKSLLSNISPLAPPLLFFSIKYKQNRLLRVSFVELEDFMIYQHVNKRTKILPLTTFLIARLCNQFDHVCTAYFYVKLQKHYFFIKRALKLSYFCKKMQNFRALEATPPVPRASGGWGLCPQTPKPAPSLRISGCAPARISDRLTVV